jgi:hypothetical protein
MAAKLTGLIGDGLDCNACYPSWTYGLDTPDELEGKKKMRLSRQLDGGWLEIFIRFY